jgi:hypothetical protein
MIATVFCETCCFECWETDPIIVYKVCKHVFHKTCLLTQEFSLLNPRCPCCEFGHIMNEEMVSKAPISKAPISKAPISKAPISKAPISKAPTIDYYDSEEDEDFPSFWLDDDDFEIESDTYSSIFFNLIKIVMSVAVIVKQVMNY